MSKIKKTNEVNCNKIKNLFMTYNYLINKNDYGKIIKINKRFSYDYDLCIVVQIL